MSASTTPSPTTQTNHFAEPQDSITSTTLARNKTSAETDAVPPPLPYNDWENLIRQLGLTGMTLQLAMNCAPANGSLINNAQVLALSISPTHSQLLSDVRRQAIEQAVQQSRGSDIRVSIEISEPEQATPAALAQQRLRQRQAAAVNEIENDSTVQSLMEIFDAQINPGSIRPVDE